MTAAATPQPPAPGRTARPRRKRRWLRWTIAGSVALIVILLGVVAAAIKLQPTPAPLALPENATAPAGPADDTYRASSGSVAGFRIQQTVIGLTNDVVGRTTDITGTVTIAGGRITDADLRVGLLALTTGEAKPAPQFATSLDTARYPDATINLTDPVTLDAAFTSGTAVALHAAGTLTLHGVTRTATATLQARRDGTSVDVAGSIPVTFADYGIAAPDGYGALGSLADHGTAEFLLVLHRS